MIRLSLFLALASVVLVGSVAFVMSGKQAAEVAITGSPQPPSQLSPTQSPPPEFVGKDVCGSCHADNFRLHSNSGHAHTLRTASDPGVLEKFLGQTYDAGEYFGTYEYTLDSMGLAAKSTKVPDRSFPLEFAFGSGHNAITLATLVPDENFKTIGMEHRASWFAATEALGQTPGQRSDPPVFAAEFFGFTKSSEEIAKCIGCHCTTADFRDDQLEVANLRPNVDCERCHGPGSHHVREATANPIKPSAYSVGREDWSAEDEIAMCGSCHRMPSEFAPPILREYANVMARFQPVGLLKSKCFLESDGMRCTTCHNPHQTSTAKSRLVYEQVCMRCHQQSSSDQTSCTVSPKANCVECHMPRIQFVEGISFHDHWIRVRTPEEDAHVVEERHR